MYLPWERRWFVFSSRRRHTRCGRDWSSDVCSSDLVFFDLGLYCAGNIKEHAWAKNRIELAEAPFAGGRYLKGIYVFDGMSRRRTGGRHDRAVQDHIDRKSVV